ncbi:TIGR02710 family CRISPR-associated protein [Methanosarcinales archaeon]|nr:MAG: TIGR02710 family CRISPR-associated protein [Methanosarcinales archaeon]
MKRALFMTVGTGIGLDKEKKVRSLAHGLLASILHYNPEKVVFFGSEESIATVESLKGQYYENRREEPINYEFVTIDSIDDFDECFDKIKDKIEEHDEHEIIIDYTSGTKTMTMSAAICSMLHHKRLSLVTGKRGENGIVIPGTEKIIEQSLYSAYDKTLLDRFKNLFNLCRFVDAKDTLSQIVVLDKGQREDYERLVEGYDLWDRFKHREAYEKIEPVKDKRISLNKGFLGRLNKEEHRIKFILVDLINNASRRIEEERYDDAVAVLYRAIELIPQIKLLDYELNDLSEGKFTIADLEQRGIDSGEYEKYADERGKLKLGLEKKFLLLRDLGWKEADDIYLENKGMQGLLQRRNNSIRAHGLEPVEKEVANELYEKTKEYARIIVPDLEKLLEDSRFPKL